MIWRLYRARIGSWYQNESRLSAPDKLLAGLEARKLCAASNNSIVRPSVRSIEGGREGGTKGGRQGNGSPLVRSFDGPLNRADRTRFRCYVSEPEGGARRAACLELALGVLRMLHISRFDCGRRFAFHDSWDLGA